MGEIYCIVHRLVVWPALRCTREKKTPCKATWRHHPLFLWYASCHWFSVHSALGMCCSGVGMLLACSGVIVLPALGAQKPNSITLRPCLDVVGFTSIHMCWSGLGWNLVQVPLQSTPTHVDWCESDYIQTRPKLSPPPQIEFLVLLMSLNPFFFSIGWLTRISLRGR